MSVLTADTEQSFAQSFYYNILADSQLESLLAGLGSQAAGGDHVTTATEDDPKGQAWTSSAHRARESGNRTKQKKNRISIAAENNHEGRSWSTIRTQQ
jgi:hypothetical protein